MAEDKNYPPQKFFWDEEAIQPEKINEKTKLQALSILDSVIDKVDSDIVEDLIILRNWIKYN